MKVLKHGRYAKVKEPLVVVCKCGCEFETILDECVTKTYCDNLCEFFEELFVNGNNKFNGGYIDKIFAICPECEDEIIVKQIIHK